MHTLRMAGPISLICALLASACADPSGSALPTSPSAVSPALVQVQSTADQSHATASSETDLSPVADVSVGLGNGNGNPNGNGNGNGNGNTNGNGGTNGNGNGNPNGNGNGNGPPTPPPGPPAPKKVELEGVIEAIVGQVITVSGQNVFVPLSVVVHHGSRVINFADLRIGDRVHVRATLVGTVLTASDVKLQNPDEGSLGGAGDTELAGAISGVTATPACPAVTFTLNGQTVKTDVATVFSPIGGCALLVNGTNVHVDGNVQLDLSILATTVTILP